jgi:hypothetical protein
MCTIVLVALFVAAVLVFPALARAIGAVVLIMLVLDRRARRGTAAAAGAPARQWLPAGVLVVADQRVRSAERGDVVPRGPENRRRLSCGL